MRGTGDQKHDLAVIIVSANDAAWLPGCLLSLERHTAGVSTDLVVIDNGSTDNTAQVVEEGFPSVRLIRAENRGFAAGNNRGLLSCSARYVLFLNPDTEILDGDFSELLDFLDAHADIGVLGCRHLMPGGSLQRTIRRFPRPRRVWAEALGCGGLPLGLARLGELVLDDGAYARTAPCDWVAGSFMLARGEAIAGAGVMDERFFLYSEEIDFCLRIAQAGWRTVYSPRMTILHHAGKASADLRLQAQKTFARRQYARKHFGAFGRRLFDAGLAAHYALRSIARLGTRRMRRRHADAGCCLRVSLGLEGSPFPTLTSVAVDRAGWTEAVGADRQEVVG